MRKQKEVIVNGEKYLITQFGAIQGVKLGKKVAKLALPTIASIYGSEAEISLNVMMDVISENLDHLDEATIQELLSQVTKGNFAIDFDKEFAGNYLTLVHLMWEVVQFNFADFFQLAQGGLKVEQPES